MRGDLRGRDAGRMRGVRRDALLSACAGRLARARRPAKAVRVALYAGRAAWQGVRVALWQARRLAKACAWRSVRAPRPARRARGALCGRRRSALLRAPAQRLRRVRRLASGPVRRLAWAPVRRFAWTPARRSVRASARSNSTEMGVGDELGSTEMGSGVAVGSTEMGSGVAVGSTEMGIGVELVEGGDRLGRGARLGPVAGFPPARGGAWSGCVAARFGLGGRWPGPPAGGRAGLDPGGAAVVLDAPPGGIGGGGLDGGASDGGGGGARDAAVLAADQRRWPARNWRRYARAGVLFGLAAAPRKRRRG